jgi:two-component system, chemotaxis family, CheB/CheR fusion protein
MGDDPNDISPRNDEQTRGREDELNGVRAQLRELRATNRRLEEANEGLQNRVEELSRANERLQNLMAAPGSGPDRRQDRVKARDRRHELLRRIVTVQEDERSRIARDLHDHLGQQLTSLRLKLDAVRERGEDHSEISQMIEQAQILAKQLDKDIDYLSWELRPRALRDFGLVLALSDFVHEWSKHFKISAEFHSTNLESIRFSEDIEINLYRIAQESLNNICKHSQATHVDVIFECRPGGVDNLALIIEDNGQGFDLNNVAVERGEAKWMGLIGMRERAALLDGEVKIESRPGNGTTIFVRIPLPPAEEGVPANEENPRPSR